MLGLAPVYRLHWSGVYSKVTYAKIRFLEHFHTYLPAPAVQPNTSCKVSRDALKEKDPIRYRSEWFDAAYFKMKERVQALLGNEIKLKEVIQPNLTTLQPYV